MICGFDLADFFVHQDFDRQLAIENLLPNFGNTLRAQRVRLRGQPSGGLVFSYDLSSGLSDHFGVGEGFCLTRFNRSNTAHAPFGGDGDCLLYILHWLVHSSLAFHCLANGINHRRLGGIKKPIRKPAGTPYPCLTFTSSPAPATAFSIDLCGLCLTTILLRAIP